MGRRTSTVLPKKVIVVNFVQSRTQSQVSIGLSCTVSKFQNTGLSQCISPWEVVRARVEFRSVFHETTWKFKILAIRNVLSHGRSYEHSFAKKRDGHKLCAKSRTESCFNLFFMHHLKISKYILAIPNVLAHGRL
ncbi:hypothetical protein BHE74_00017070 [Ensete ventricosum]|nr:hypothetical protein BHE74_00017070 [Ensete ventricosum]